MQTAASPQFKNRLFLKMTKPASSFLKQLIFNTGYTLSYPLSSYNNFFPFSVSKG
ncbi:hypothetical protein HMPREF0322_03314 [Desulfitobacterium hafniense DP7]|uniref:Uncharacterized protein n=1 Tax=Desulfitobacterium hafniense DP7 TaxID=537010 RepID=G9XQR6_DESHA|nr:hypothetical protein HMPREF0322_03314 [Desulfitobacterium hafniense DP7]